jgi:hypothetical protein
MGMSATVESKTECDNARPLFFPVSVAKLIVLSIVTVGIYEIYWFYKNWVLVRQNERRMDIKPFWRALFAIFFCYALLVRVRAQQNSPEGQLSSVPAGALTAGWIITTLLFNLPRPYSFIGLLAVLFIVPVQRAANRINTRVAPNHKRNSRFTALDWATVIVMGFILATALMGYLGIIPHRGSAQ